MIPVAQIQHGHVLTKLSWRQVVEQGLPAFTVNQEHNALFPDHHRGDRDTFAARSVNTVRNAEPGVFGM